LVTAKALVLVIPPMLLARAEGDRIESRVAAIAHGRYWHETDVLCVPTNVCCWGKSGRAADITAKTDFDPNGLREHSRDLPIAALVTDRPMEVWYHPSIA
jgi:hypothetical protein